MNRDALAAALARLAALEARLAEGAEAEAEREREIARLTAEREALEREVADLRDELHERAAPAPAEPPARPAAPDGLSAMLAEALAASRAGQPETAIQRISAILARDFQHAPARALLGTARCLRCRTRVLEPSAATSVVDYARFWRGVCPRCEGPLSLG